jgi:hypothetical protein
LIGLLTRFRESIGNKPIPALADKKGQKRTPDFHQFSPKDIQIEKPTKGRDGRSAPAGSTLKKHSGEAQERICGNSVSPPVAAAIVSANVHELSIWTQKQKRRFTRANRNPVQLTA